MSPGLNLSLWPISTGLPFGSFFFGTIVSSYGPKIYRIVFSLKIHGGKVDDDWLLKVPENNINTQ